MRTVAADTRNARKIAKARNDVHLVARAYVTGFVKPGQIYRPGIDKILTLPKRQREVIELVTQGISYLEIADTLGIAPSTVRLHRADALHAVGERRAVWLAILGYESGLLPIAGSVVQGYTATDAHQHDPQGHQTS